MRTMRSYARRAVLGLSTMEPNAAAPKQQCASYSTTTVRLRFHYRKRRLTADDAIDPLTKPTNIDKGALHVVSVPIGNLKDFTIRALDVLHDVDYIITSDRPATKTLLDLVNVPSQGRMVHFSRSNQTATCEKLVEMLRGGRSMALVTTSGTPCVGDIGASLVQEMQSHGIRVTPVPGCSAVMGALAMCGVTGSRYDPNTIGHRARDEGNAAGAPLPIHELSGLQEGSFFFGNMLPEAHGARLRILRNVVGPASFPCVYYEVPRRLVLTLQDIAAILPRRRVYVAHEITKLNESLHVDIAENLVRYYMTEEARAMLSKGQLVVVIGGATPEDTARWLEREAARRRRLRRSVEGLMRKGTTSTSASLTEEAPHHDTVKGSGRETVLKRRKSVLRKKREHLIRAIEQEQERLRLQLTINRNDASRF